MECGGAVGVLCHNVWPVHAPPPMPGIRGITTLEPYNTSPRRWSCSLCPLAFNSCCSKRRDRTFVKVDKRQTCSFLYISYNLSGMLLPKSALPIISCPSPFQSIARPTAIHSARWLGRCVIFSVNSLKRLQLLLIAAETLRLRMIYQICYRPRHFANLLF